MEEQLREIAKAINVLIERQTMTNAILAELVEIFSEGGSEPEEMQSAGCQPQSLDD